MAFDSSNYRDWFIKAENDLMAGRGILYYYEEPPTDAICYHAHQVAEKSLKGFLIYKTGRMPKMHDLIELVNLAIALDERLKELKDDMELLNKYYVETKYPLDQPIEYSKAEAKDAITKAEIVIKVIKGKIGGK